MNDDLVPELLAARSAVDELLDSAPAALTPAVHWADGPYVAVAHEDAFTREPDGTAHLEKRRYLLTRVAEHRYPELLAQLARAWHERGWAVDGEADPVLPVLRAKSPHGTAEFRIGFAGNGTLLARVDGLAAPGTSYPFGGASTVPIGPEGAMDTMPRRQDPFWSV
ncbi:hypothetical protein [Kitasatospora phosalacinea]|uniref:Uncharacterized protein n=1 Tax=Kitasatospora phosalacinea TaxID=2065 RepID=A0A9W6UPZ0_9ACTN|nr:hypothetical protein [Kitasatospora phosalacinea]GLW56519.1 hypothetical protein Kpho01_45300 [Kitasatospora phosalacinea]